jgi:hypothetical protein
MLNNLGRKILESVQFRPVVAIFQDYIYAFGHKYEYITVLMKYGLCMHGEVIFDDVKPEVMETLIYFIYHDAIQDELKINIDLLLAADKYKILGLIDVCAVYLEANLSLEIGLDVMISAYLTNQKSLFAAASNFVCENKGEFVKSDFWNEMLT